MEKNTEDMHDLWLTPDEVQAAREALEYALDMDFTFYSDSERSLLEKLNGLEKDKD